MMYTIYDAASTVMTFYLYSMNITNLSLTASWIWVLSAEPALPLLLTKLQFPNSIPWRNLLKRKQTNNQKIE